MLREVLGIAIRITLVLAGMFLGLFIAEKTIDYYYTDLTLRGEEEGELYQYDASLGWKNSPNSVTRRKPPDSLLSRVRYAHNSKGLREDEEYPYQKPAHTYRILALGDSFAYGFGVEQAETTVEVLERLLKEQGDFEVINMGVAGYGLGQEMLYYEMEGYKYQPDLVILFFFENDISDSMGGCAWSTYPKPDFEIVEGELIGTPPPGECADDPDALEGTDRPVSFRRRLIRLFPRTYDLVKQGMALVTGDPEIKKTKGPCFYEPQWKQSDTMKKRWALASALLERLKRDVEKDGAQLLVVNTQNVSQIHCFSNSLTEFMNEICTRANIGYLDLLAGFPAQRSPYYFRHDGHLAAAGHDLAAHLIYDQLLRANFNTRPLFTKVDNADASEGPLALLDYAYGVVSSNFPPSRALPGEKVWTASHWRKTKPVQQDCKVSIQMVDDKRHVIQQVDLTLLNGKKQGTSQWSEDEVAMGYRLLSVPPTTPPGEYWLRLNIYLPQTLETLPLVGEASEVELGPLRVEPGPYHPAVEELTIKHPLSQDWLDAIRLVGYDLPLSEKLKVGAQGTLSLYWQVRRKVDRDLGVALFLRDESGEALVGPTVRLAGDAYPTTRWSKGEILKGYCDFTLDADVKPGPHQLVLRLMDMTTGEVLNQAGTEIGSVQVEDRPRNFTLPSVQRPMRVNLGNKVELVGYDLDANKVAAGDTLHLKLYWRALAEMETSYKVFTHLIGEDDQIWGQKDDFPGQGTLPTSGWMEGEVIADEYLLEVEPAAPSGQYRLKAGMYDPLSGERLPVIDEKGQIQGDRVLLDTVHVIQ